MPYTDEQNFQNEASKIFSSVRLGNGLRGRGQHWGNDFAKDAKEGAYGLNHLMGNAIGDQGYAREYRESLDELSRRRLEEGLGQNQQAMAAQAVSRGSNPLAARAALYAGGQAAAQTSNQMAQQTAQADMAGAELAQKQKQLEMQGVAAMMQQHANEQQMINQRRMQNAAIKAGEDKWMKDMFLGLGMSGMNAMSMGLTGGAM